MTTTTKKATRGGAREGAGRKRLADEVASLILTIRTTPEQKAKFHALGGAEWFRRALERAKVPTTKGGAR